MTSSFKPALALAAVIAGAGVVCPLCIGGVEGAGAQNVRAAVQAPDSATVRLHISGMTCGTCPTTARLALARLAGVYSAKVTLDDSLGVVTYDPRRLSPEQIAAHLAKVTDYRATVLKEPAKARAPRAP